MIFVATLLSRSDIFLVSIQIFLFEADFNHVLIYKHFTHYSVVIFLKKTAFIRLIDVALFTSPCGLHLLSFFQDDLNRKLTSTGSKDLF